MLVEVSASGTCLGVEEPPTLRSVKDLGAYYTDDLVASFLVWWAVRSPADTVMDPCFGAGVFLRQACERLRTLGGDPRTQVFGVEIEAGSHRHVTAELSDQFGVPSRNLQCGDFFEIEPDESPYDAVVGNPPFIRYQRFKGEARRRALDCAARHCVRLSALSSSWAPFIVHSVASVRPGGRLAMVVPAEIGHATYARAVLSHLRRSFGRITLVSFREKLFPGLSEDTLLLLAEERAADGSSLLWRNLTHAGELGGLVGGASMPPAVPIDGEALAKGHVRLKEYLVPEGLRSLYRALSRHPGVRRLGDLADIGIGYVTGANGFFHLTPASRDHWSIPYEFLRPAVRRSRALRGVRLTTADWERGLLSADTAWLLYLRSETDIPAAVHRYLQAGERQGVSKAYKCRTREPWYQVPHVYQPDALLTYMSGETPRLVSNCAGVVAPNTFHVVRLRRTSPLTATALSLLWQSSLSQFSAEMEGHALGGGMLKLEPTEAERVLVPICPPGWLPGEVLDDWDRKARNGEGAGLQALADQIILREGLGLSGSEIGALRDGLLALRDRRAPRRKLS